MIKTYSVYTSEVDAPKIAVEDIQNQIDILPLCRNSVGIVACHYDFVENGILSALQKKLPFPLIGITTFYQATANTSGLFELTITVLTSDDVHFLLAYSAADQENSPRERIERVYSKNMENSGESPALILNFLSANRPLSGDEYLRLLDDVAGGIPAFGMVNSGEDDSGVNIYVFCCDEVFSEGFAMLFLTGDVSFKTYATTAYEERLLGVSTTVTKADETTVEELNGLPAMTYLKRNGVALDEAFGDIVTPIPFYCRFPGDEVLIGRALKSFGGEKLEFMAEFPEGSLMRIGTMTAKDILDESRSLIRQAVEENPNAELFLIGSCVGRYIILGLETTSEMDCVTSEIPEATNYLACYVGGEICPVKQDGALINRFHNNSLIVCVIR